MPTKINIKVRPESSSNEVQMNEPSSPNPTIPRQVLVETKVGLLQAENMKKKNPCRRRKWAETMGIGKEITHVLAIVRSLRLDFRCFGTVPATSSSSSCSEDGNEEEEEEEDSGDSPITGAQGNDAMEEENEKKESEQESHVPSPLQDGPVLMRCMSAPAKGWWLYGDDQQGAEEEEEKTLEDRVLVAHNAKQPDQEDSERLILMSYAPDFFRVSPDISKKMWDKKSGCLNRCHSLMR